MRRYPRGRPRTRTPATIPMRGNERDNDMGAVTPAMATIPMRGNEVTAGGSGSGSPVGYDPHEG